MPVDAWPYPGAVVRSLDQAQIGIVERQATRYSYWIVAWQDGTSSAGVGGTDFFALTQDQMRTLVIENVIKDKNPSAARILRRMAKFLKN